MQHITTQEEISVARPPRSWAKIREKIAQLRGQDFKVAKPQVRMKQYETIEQYCERHPEQALTINISVSKNYSPQIPQNDNFHRPRHLNLVKLNSDNTILILQLTTAPSN
jgi:hypothetical protein